MSALAHDVLGGYLATPAASLTWWAARAVRAALRRRRARGLGA
ncbi:hypothetical protein ACGFXC_34250 [Streptomyces sp. NPDC048507]